uniref:Beta-Casp domain-containing protein n=1 Tax=Oncorhynchus tshawytscha TaxID=74940 RepID=A0A8C8CUM6_ONCTS
MFSVYMLKVPVQLHVLNDIMKHIEDNSHTVNNDMDLKGFLDLAAWFDKGRPDILISESTYATTSLHETVERGGKVLIPVFALGRAQELCILLETFWGADEHEGPPSTSPQGSQRKPITSTNSSSPGPIRKTFEQRNTFEFKHIKAFDRSYADNQGPMGQKHHIFSLQIFKKCAGNEKNMEKKQSYFSFYVYQIMTGYCVQGTIRLTQDPECAHADAKGIMQLFRMAEPRNMLLVHGEARQEDGVLQVLEDRAVQGVTPGCPCNPNCIKNVRVWSIFMHCPRMLHLLQFLRLVSPEQALNELGLNVHQLRFTCRVQPHDAHSDPDTPIRIHTHLNRYSKASVFRMTALPGSPITLQTEFSVSNRSACCPVLWQSLWGCHRVQSSGRLFSLYISMMLLLLRAIP